MPKVITSLGAVMAGAALTALAWAPAASAQTSCDTTTTTAAADTTTTTAAINPSPSGSPTPSPSTTTPTPSPSASANAVSANALKGGVVRAAVPKATCSDVAGTGTGSLPTTGGNEQKALVAAGGVLVLAYGTRRAVAGRRASR